MKLTPGSDVPRLEETARRRPSPGRPWPSWASWRPRFPGSQNRSRLPVIQAKVKCPFTRAAPVRRLRWWVCEGTVIPQESHLQPHEHSSAFVDEASALNT